VRERDRETIPLVQERLFQLFHPGPMRERERKRERKKEREYLREKV
jgi:hypothetical protein